MPAGGASDRQTIVVAAHAPHEHTRLSIKNSFQWKLRGVIASAAACVDAVVLLGDFNATVVAVPSSLNDTCKVKEVKTHDWFSCTTFTLVQDRHGHQEIVAEILEKVCV